jgi:hypothetical protein
MTPAEPGPPIRSASRRLRLAYLVSHPIQYQAPLLRRIAQEPDIDLTVLFGSDFSVRGYTDAGFGVGVKWDIPLLEGYKCEFLPRLRDTGNATFASPINRGIVGRLRSGSFDALWVHGYATVNAIHGILATQSLGIPVLLRAESWLGDRYRTPAKLALKHALMQLLQNMIDAVLPIGTLNAQYWHRYFGDDIPQFPMPYAVDNAWFAQRAREAHATRATLQAELQLDPGRPVILFASKLQPRTSSPPTRSCRARRMPSPTPTSSSSAMAKSAPRSNSRPPPPVSLPSASAVSATSLSCLASSISPPSSSCPPATSPGASSSTKS